MTTATSAPRTKAEIEAELAAAFEKLSADVASFIGEVHPKAIVDRTVEDARDFAAEKVSDAKVAFAGVKEQFTDADGSIRPDRLGWLAAAVGGTVTFVVLVRSILKGRKK